jgi:hypothetical protein
LHTAAAAATKVGSLSQGRRKCAGLNGSNFLSRACPKTRGPFRSGPVGC